jgi:ribosomal protein S18 acetylase RimI-like enzyme
LKESPARAAEASARDVIDSSGDLVEIYRAAFSQPPWNEEPSRVDMFRRHIPTYAGREDFRAVLAHDDEGIVGFALGARLNSEAWWRADVAARLTDEQIREWLEDCYELIEIAVLPGSQGRGLGTALHDELFASVTTRTALLSTHPRAERALALYERRGWRVLIDDFQYSPVAQARLIMGLELKAGGDA